MKTNDTTRVTTEAMAASSQITCRYLLDVDAKICRVKSLNELLFMAGESLTDRDHMNAITTGADIINDLLEEASQLIDCAVAAVKGGDA